MSTKTKRHSLRGPDGRYISLNKTVVKATSKTNTKGTVTVKNSSFIDSITVRENGLVDVVMNRNSKTVYTYKPTSAGLKSIQKAIKTGASLGHTYNDNLRGREVSRTIYVK